MSDLATSDPSASVRPRPRWRGRVRAWGPAFLWAGFVFVMSAIPGATLPPLAIPNLDKVVHAAVYGVLGMLCWRGVRLTQGLDPARTVIMATAIATLYGITDEFHQMFTPNRMPDWRDAVADAGGSFLGALACAIVSLARRSGNRQPPL
jgi:VanZ family protein